MLTKLTKKDQHNDCWWILWEASRAKERSLMMKSGMIIGDINSVMCIQLSGTSSFMQTLEFIPTTMLFWCIITRISQLFYSILVDLTITKNSMIFGHYSESSYNNFSFLICQICIKIFLEELLCFHIQKELKQSNCSSSVYWFCWLAWKSLIL